MRFYTLLLHLYPTGFRHAYGAEMMGVLRAALERATGVERAFLWLHAIADVLWNAPAAHAGLLRQDLQYCMRTVARTPAFAVTVIAVTALAVGGASTVLTLADSAFVRPLPFTDPDRLV